MDVVCAKIALIRKVYISMLNEKCVIIKNTAIIGPYSIYTSSLASINLIRVVPPRIVRLPGVALKNL